MRAQFDSQGYTFEQICLLRAFGYERKCRFKPACQNITGCSVLGVCASRAGADRQEGLPLLLCKSQTHFPSEIPTSPLRMQMLLFRELELVVWASYCRPDTMKALFVQQRN